MPKIVYYWLTMGDYHYSRMNALAEIFPDLTVIELTNLDDHGWKLTPKVNFTHIRLHENKPLTNRLVRESVAGLKKELNRLKPEIIINGAGFFDYKTTIHLWYLSKIHSIKYILWSESTIDDNPQTFIKTIVKKQLVNLFDAHLVAGNKHYDYIKSLGVPTSHIYKVGNVVNNLSFEHTIPFEQRGGFLFVGRLLKIKNVSTLIKAYSIYRQSDIYKKKPWNLTIVGDGPESESLLKLISSLELIDDILLTGNLQPDEVRHHYQRNTVFILPSTSEPWGLVLNEAMASEMALLVSSQCGSIDDLILNGNNGFTFDPLNPEGLAKYMIDLASKNEMTKSLAQNAKYKISEFTPNTYAKACKFAIENILQI